MKRRKSYRLIFYNLKCQVPHSMLTPPQQEVMRFIEVYFERYGRFPSLRAIACGEIDSKQITKTKRSNLENIAEILDRLFEQGWIGKAEKQNKGCWTTRAESDEWTGPRQDY